jgi:hypothetical protein
VDRWPRWVIYVEKPKKREFLLCTKQRQSRDEWINAILALINHKTPGLASPLASFPSGLSSSVSSLAASSSFSGLKSSTTERESSLSDSGYVNLSVEETPAFSETSTDAGHWKRYVHILAHLLARVFIITPSSFSHMFVYVKHIARFGLRLTKMTAAPAWPTKRRNDSWKRILTNTTSNLCPV